MKWKDLRIPPIHRIAAGEHKVPVVKGSTETRSVTLASPLGLAEPETTRALWQAQGGPETAGEKDPDGQACMEVLGGLLAQDDRPITCVSVSEVLLWLNRLSRAAGYDEVYSLDAAQVTWHRDRAGFRLPTRDEWEVGAWARTGRCISTSPAGFTTRGGKGEFQSNILLAPVGTWKDDRACWLLQDPHGNASELVWTLPDPGGDATVRAFNGESSKSWLRLGKGVTREVDDDLALTLATSHSKPQTLLSADSRALDAGFRIAWGAVENK